MCSPGSYCRFVLYKVMLHKNLSTITHCINVLQSGKKYLDLLHKILGGLVPPNAPLLDTPLSPTS